MGWFDLFYRFVEDVIDQHKYQPNFADENGKAIYMLEPKVSNKMCAPEIQAKKTAAEQWCRTVSEYTTRYSGKPWKYVLIPHDKIQSNMTLEGLVGWFGK